MRHIAAAFLTLAALCVVFDARAATIVVDALTDLKDSADNNCEFREAVTAAEKDTAVDQCVAGQGADTIVLPSGTIALTGANFAIDGHEVTILGQGMGLTIISKPTGSTLVVDSFGSLSISNLTVSTSPIYVSWGDLSATQVHFFQSSAGGGGAMRIDRRGDATITDCVFEENSATAAGGAIHLGSPISCVGA